MKSTQHFFKRTAGFALVSFAFPLAAYAQLTQTTALVNAGKTVLNSVVVSVFTLALIVFAWGVVKYLTAAGDAAKLKLARPFLWWGIIGLFVLESVWGLIKFIADELDIGNPETQGTIKPLKIE